jgi:signal transduction histidine kinase
MMVPLTVRSELIGSVTLICFDQQGYTATDVQLAEDLCRRAATAIQNAALYARSEKVQQDLTKANVAKDEFLAIMSHELRSPLATLYGSSTLLARGAVPLDSPDCADLIQDMAASAERLVRLTDDLMFLARVQLGERPPVEPLNTKNLIEKVTEEFLAGHPDRKIVVRAISRIRPILASETYVRQILLNLLGNADKYCPAGVPVTVKASRVADEVIITVADEGVGLARGETERIFDPFYRADNAQGIKGSGIGLLVCRTLVEIQSGHIWAHDDDARGLQVSFSLPVAPS